MATNVTGKALAAIALGSNMPGPLGSREANLQAAIEALATAGTVIAVSTFHDTAAVGPTTDQPRFLNAAALLQTAMPPLGLLNKLLHIEQSLGRDRSHGIPKGPRTLDLDVLLYSGIVMETPELTLPHPEMHRRFFVLAPLAEIAPNLLHPNTGLTIHQLLVRLNEGPAFRL